MFKSYAHCRDIGPLYNIMYITYINKQTMLKEQKLLFSSFYCTYFFLLFVHSTNKQFLIFFSVYIRTVGPNNSTYFIFHFLLSNSVFIFYRRSHASAFEIEIFQINSHEKNGRTNPPNKIWKRNSLCECLNVLCMNDECMHIWTEQRKSLTLTWKLWNIFWLQMWRMPSFLIGEQPKMVWHGIMWKWA